jgi:hypothetical protein
VSDAPTLVIGAVDRPRPEVFHDVRGAISLGTGDVAIADGASRQLRVFTAAGVHLATFGGEGDGPDEFRGIEWIDQCGDSLITVYDSARFRITKWDRVGELVDEFAIEGPGGLPPYSARCGPDGRFAIVGWHDVSSAAIPQGPYRPNVSVGIADAGGRFERTIGTFPGSERYRGTSNDRPHPFGKTTTALLGTDAVYVGTADSLAIDVLSFNGEKRTIGRSQGPAVLTARQKDAWVELYLRRAPEGRRPALHRAILDANLVPETKPAYGDVLMDDSGYLWLERYRITDAPQTWEVFAPGGAMVSTVVLPDGFRPTEITKNHILGIHADAEGVQRVARFELFRAEGGAALTPAGDR